MIVLKFQNNHKNQKTLSISISMFIKDITAFAKENPLIFYGLVVIGVIGAAILTFLWYVSYFRYLFLFYIFDA